MARSRSNTRGTAHSYPRGVLSIMRGGYGFVTTAEGEFFIPANKLNGAFDGDVVDISPARQERSKKALKKAAEKTRKREARVKRVVERSHPEIIGRYEVAEPFGVVVPEDPRIPYDIFTLRSESPDVPDGATVRVAITTYPSRKEAATGSVVEVLGDDDDERLPIDLIVARHKLETAFSAASLEEAAVACVDADAALAEGYRDLRERFVFTIDPEDARDFDDAVSLDAVVVEDWDTMRWRPAGGGSPAADCRLDGTGPSTGTINLDGRPITQAASSLSSADPGAANGATNRVDRPASDNGATNPGDRHTLHAPDLGFSANGTNNQVDRPTLWRLGVHIADVAHYVPWASSIDLDARRRATSVYLVDRVVPMLPEQLSCDICSLRPGEVRRTMTVDMYLDDAGSIVFTDIYPALIRSDARLTYEQAQGIIEADGADELAELSSRVRQLSSIAEQRMALRRRAGGLDFDTVEAKVRLDDDGAPIDIVLRQKTRATQLIEEAMIAANEAVARHLRDAGFPCVYRVHEKPSRESLAGLVPVLQEFAWFKDIDEDRFVAGNPQVIAHVLDACAQRGEGPLVTTLLLRAQKRAQYSADLGGHYALASEAYAHFTSPIRRYPDLVVHRMLKALIHGRPKKFDQEVSNMAWIAEHSSEMERIAERAARESQEAKIVELMETQVGATFSGMIAGVANYGLFVRLDNTAEGMVPIEDLGREYFSLDPVRHTLTGSDSGRQYRLGKHVAVRLVEADRRTRQLRFRLV